MITLKKLISKALTVDGLHVLFDENKMHLVLLGDKSEVIGTLAVSVSQGVARVSHAATIGNRLGLGYRMYLTMMALLSHRGIPFSADCNSVSGNAISLWDNLFICEDISKAPLPIEAQSMEYNFEFFEELQKTNLLITEPQWDALFELDADRLIAKMESGEISPHLYNHGFSVCLVASAPLLRQVEHIQIEPSVLSLASCLWDKKIGSL